MTQKNTPVSAREQQRLALKAEREKELRKQRTTRTAVIAGIVVAALAAAAGLGLLIYRSMQPPEPAAAPPGMNQDQPYLAFGAPSGSGKPVVEIHLDFMCPACGQFESIQGPDIEQMVAQEEITLHLVPRRMLDTASTTGDYSSRAANALVAAYAENPATALILMRELFAAQPIEHSDGLTDDELWAHAQTAGASETVKAQIQEGEYIPWVRQVAEPYAQENGAGTPYVEINGVRLEAWSEPGILRRAVQEVSS